MHLFVALTTCPYNYCNKDYQASHVERKSVISQYIYLYDTFVAYTCHNLLHIERVYISAMAMLWAAHMFDKIMLRIRLTLTRYEILWHLLLYNNTLLKLIDIYVCRVNKVEWRDMHTSNVLTCCSLFCNFLFSSFSFLLSLSKWLLLIFIWLTSALSCSTCVDSWEFFISSVETFPSGCLSYKVKQGYALFT